MSERSADKRRLSRRRRQYRGDDPHWRTGHDHEATHLLAWARRTCDELADLDEDFTRRWEP
jgi:hypothetical protein